MYRQKAIIVDTTAFIAGFNIYSVHGEVYSVPEVERELIGDSISKLRLKMAIEDGRLKLREPDGQALSKARETSLETGDFLSLSEADMKIIALAVQLKDEGYMPEIITDDYAIQNVAKKLNVKYASVITYGIKYQLRWVLYCPACHREYPPGYESEICENCGTRLKRKPMSKNSCRNIF